MARQKAHKDAVGRRRRDDRAKGRPKSLTGGGVVMLTKEQDSAMAASPGTNYSSSGEVKGEDGGDEGEDAGGVEVFGSSGPCLMSKYPPSSRPPVVHDRSKWSGGATL